MDPNTVVLEVSSDEEIGWNDTDGSGIADGSDDHNWLADLLEEVNKDKYGDDSDDVVVVSEIAPSEKHVKSKLKSSVVDLDDDCVVLDNDPNEAVGVRNDNPSKGDDDDSDDIVVVSEKGQVACRDYPHPRHLCIKFPFNTTPNQSHCEQCYCYVCDSLAPCVYWGNGSASMDHCNATDKYKFWTLERKNAKNGNKRIQIHDQFVDLQIPEPSQAQPQIQIPRPGLINACRTSANFQPPNIINQNRNPINASRNQLHPDLVSQLLSRTHVARVDHNHNHNRNRNLGTKPRGFVFKRTGSVGVAPTANQNLLRSYRGNFGYPHRQQNYNVNEMLSGQNKYSGSLQQNAVHTSVSYPPQSQTCTSSIVNQPLPPQPQFSNHSNPNYQSQLNSTRFLENPLYQPHLVPTSSRPELALGQPSYTVPAQSSYPAASQTRVDNPSIPVSNHTHNFVKQNQAHSPIMDTGFKDYGLNWPPSQDSGPIVGAGPTNGSSLGAGSDSLSDHRFDWIFDDQPVEPGLMDINGPYGLTDFSSDSSFMDTGPIFDF